MAEEKAKECADKKERLRKEKEAEKELEKTEHETHLKTKQGSKGQYAKQVLKDAPKSIAQTVKPL